MNKRRLSPIVLAILAALLAACASAPRTEPGNRTPLNVAPSPPVRTYRVSVVYTNQDDIGVPLDLLEIQATARIGRYGQDEYVSWDSYEFRKYRASANPGPWEIYLPAVGFDYIMTPVRQEPDYIKNLPDMDSIPRDLVGLYFYINLIDLHMWDLYRYLFLQTREVFPYIPEGPVSKIGDAMTVDLSSLPIALVEWENVSKGLTMSGGVIHAEYLGRGSVGGVETQIIAFDQAQTLKQSIYGVGMWMPYDGTNRFLGHMHVDGEGSLVLGTYREFVYARVKAPMSQIVHVHSQRDYRIERVAEE